MNGWDRPAAVGGRVGRDQNGRIFGATLPPGEYLRRGELKPWMRRGGDPTRGSSTQDLSRLATPFTLTEGETRVIDLKVVVQP